MDDDDGGLLGIGLGDGDATSESDDQAAQGDDPRTSQTEEQFQAVRRSYRPKIENGELWKNITLPLPAKITKPEAQELLSAIEELYFFRRYAEAAKLLQEVLREENTGGLDQEHRELLARYEQKCRDKIAGMSSSEE